MLTQDKADQLQENCIKRIQDKSNKQKTLIFEYALLLVQNVPHLFDWGKINQAILERYKLSGLEKIKEGAWKVHDWWLERELKIVWSKIKW